MQSNSIRLNFRNLVIHIASKSVKHDFKIAFFLLQNCPAARGTALRPHTHLLSIWYLCLSVKRLSCISLFSLGANLGSFCTKKNLVHLS